MPRNASVDDIPVLDNRAAPAACVSPAVTPVKEPASPLQMPQLPAADLEGVERPIFVDESVEPEALNFDYVGLEQKGDDDDDVLLFRHQAYWRAGRRCNHPKRLKSKLAAAEDLRKLKRVLAIAQGKARRAGTKKRHVDNPTLKEALAGPYAQLVRDAIDAEIAQYTEVYEAMKILSKEECKTYGDELRRALTSHIEITYKRDPETGQLIKVKARLVIHGNQTSKYDYADIKSPTVRSATVKLLLSLAAKHLPGGKRFKMAAWDVPGAFLQTSIDERTNAHSKVDPSYVPPRDIFVKLPDGRYTKLLSYAYGLKQASLEFHNTMVELLLAEGYLATSDPCLFTKQDGAHISMVAVHVDDLLMISTSDAEIERLDACLVDRWEQRDKGNKLSRQRGPLIKYLNMVIQEMDDGSIFVSQPVYAMNVVRDWGIKYGLVDENDPVDVSYPMHATQAYAEGDEEPIDSTWFKGVVGALLYLGTMTRPDLLFCLSILASHSNAPTVADKRAVRRVLRYVQATSNKGLLFRADEDTQLYAWADASFASREDSRSQSGYCFSIGRDNASFYARSSKQLIVTLSSTESEYVALFACATEVVFLRRLLQELGFDQGPAVVFQDNMSTIHWAQGRESIHRTKHILVKYHFTRQLVIDGIIQLNYLPTEDMRADVQTKPLVKEVFQRLANMHLGLPEDA